MANQILAGAVFQASMVIAGVDANNPPYVGPPPRIVAMRQYTYMTDPGDNTVYTMAMDGTDLQTLPFPDGLVQDKNGDYAKNIATDGNMLVVADEDHDTVYVYDMATGEAPTSFSVPELSNDRHTMFLSSGRLFTRSNYLSPLSVYDIVSGTKVGEYDTSDNTGFHKLFVEGGKVVAVPFDENYPTQRYMYIYDVGDNDGSSEIKVALPVLSNGYKTNVSVSVGNEQIVFGDENEDSIFYIYDLNGENRIDVDTSSIVPGGYWGNSMTMAGRMVGHAASAIGDGKIVINSAFPGMLFVCDLDGSNLNVIDLYNLTPSSEHYKFNGMASVNSGNLSIADGKIIAPAINGRIDDANNESEGIIWVLDLHARTVISQIPSPVLGLSVYFGYDHGTYLTTATPLSVSGIESAYTLLSGSTNIYATSTVGGVTWSFEEVLASGDGYVAVTSPWDDDTGTNTGSVYIYNTNDLSAQPVELTSTELDDNAQMGETDVVFGAGKVIVGARRDSGHDGAVYVYDLSDLSATPTRLTGPSNTEARFGRSVAVHSTNLIVGAEWDPAGGYKAGRVYVYDLNDLSASPTTIIPTDIRESAHFGSSVTVSDDLLFIGAPYGDASLGSSQAAGALYVYNANDFSLIKKLTSPNVQAGDDFGGGTVDSNAVSVSGNNLIVGSSGRNTQRGGVYVFTLDNLNAAPTELTAFDGSSGDYFGVSVASTSEYIIVGASGHDANTTNDGAVYIYDINDLSAQPTKIDSPETTQYAGFGKSVSATEDQIFVAAPNYDTYVYSTSDLSLIQTLLKPADVTTNQGFSRVVVAHKLPSPDSGLNGTAVTQSNNVFTVTPGTEDASFDLTFTATDSSGNSASSTASFTFEAPEPVELIPAITDQNSFEQVFTSVYDAQAKWDTPNGPAITIRNSSATVGIHSVMAEGVIAVNQGQQYVFSADIADPNGDASAKLFIQNGNTELVIGGSSIPAGYVFHSDSVTFTAETDSVTIKIKRNASVNTDYYKNLSLIG